MIGKLVNIKLCMMNRKVTRVGCPDQDELSTTATPHKMLSQGKTTSGWFALMLLPYVLPLPAVYS